MIRQLDERLRHFERYCQVMLTCDAVNLRMPGQVNKKKPAGQINLVEEAE